MKSTTIAFAAVLMACGRAIAAPCFDVRIESVDGLTIQQVAQLSSQQAQINGQHTAIVWAFDPEDRPRRRSMEAVALLIVATGDLGEQPVGALIWSTGAAELRLENLPRDGFRIVAGKAEENCASSIFEIHVLADGRVRANQQVIGKLH